MTTLAALEEIIDASGVAPRMEAHLARPARFFVPALRRHAFCCRRFHVA
jgi:hypothetical protein